MIYFTSDLHLFHDRDFIYAPRGFKTIYEMNNAIVNNWNSIVTMEDDVYVLGDIMLNNDEDALKLFKSLKGKIHIVFGNHDTDNRIALYETCWNVVETNYSMRFRYGKYHFYLSHFPSLCAQFDSKPITHKTINLCGHTHTKDPFCDAKLGLIYHCELDAHNNRLVSIDQIIKDIENYQNLNF